MRETKNTNVSMTPRERVRAVTHFRKPDALPWVEDFDLETVLKWFRQGLSPDRVITIDWSVWAPGALLNWPAVKGFDANGYFNCQTLWSCVVPVDVGPIPRFKQRMTGEDARFYKYVMETGVHALRSKSAEHSWYAMPMFTDFPVRDRKSWEEYKKRLDPKDPRRYPKDWEKDVYLDVFEKYQGGNTMISISGFYGFGAQLMGIPNFALAFYKEPDLIHDMVDYWEYFVTEATREAVESLRNRIDMVFWWEDMAERHGPNISPRLYKEILLPRYKRVTSFFNKNQIDRIVMDSDGNINAILDLVSEAGITGLLPLEVNSGMDAREIRRDFGQRFFLRGNLDKRELAKGGEPMRREVDSKIPAMKEMGGCMAGADHLIHVDFDLDKFMEYANYLRDKLPYQTGPE